MGNLPNIETKIERIINASEGIKSAEPKAYFYSRLHARMERELLASKNILGWQLKPIYALSAVAIVLIINVFTLLNLQKIEKNAQEQYQSYESLGY